MLIQEAIDAYVRNRCPELKTGDAVIKELAGLYGYYDGRYLDELADIAREYIEDERSRLKPASIRNRLSYLRAACRYAQQHHGIGDLETQYRISMPTVRNARQVYASRAEMLLIARTCEDRSARALVRLAFYSGMRLGELMAMSDRNEILPDGFLLRDTKNGEDRIAPMHPRLRVLLKYLPFKYRKVWLQRLVRRAMNAAGFPHMRLHDLRHSTASAMINNGVDLHTVGAVLGHKDSRSTARYSHLAARTLNAAVRKIR